MKPLLASLLKLCCGECWSTMNCIWTLVHLHVSSESSKPSVEYVCAYVNNFVSNLVECVDFIDLTVALL